MRAQKVSKIYSRQGMRIDALAVDSK